jgi:uncharacterized protein YabE (DUF348 family)
MRFAGFEGFKRRIWEVTMKQAKLVKRGEVKPEPPAQPKPAVVKTLTKSLVERVKTAEAARTDARTAFAALFASA